MMPVSILFLGLGVFLLNAGESPDKNIKEVLSLVDTPKGLAYILLFLTFVMWVRAITHTIWGQFKKLPHFSKSKLDEDIQEEPQAEDGGKEPAKPKTLASDYNLKRYSLSLTRMLRNQAAYNSDQATVLLERGIFYVWFGIVFYLCSIIGWQLVIAQWTFHTAFIYGMASCTFLFLFIEFLSAWFLRQYRHFVDTATYLLKVKAIFDRYRLLFLIITEEKSGLSEESLRLLSKALTDDFPWPNDSHLNKADVAFAKEAMASLTSLVKASRMEKKHTRDD